MSDAHARLRDFVVERGVSRELVEGMSYKLLDTFVQRKLARLENTDFAAYVYMYESYFWRVHGIRF